MPNSKLTLSNSQWPALRRLWILRTAQRGGDISNRRRMALFGISRAQASGDLQQLLQEHPGLLHYNLTAKTYQWSRSVPWPKVSPPAWVWDL